LNFDNPNKRANEILKSVERRPGENGEEIVGDLTRANVLTGRRYQHCRWYDSDLPKAIPVFFVVALNSRLKKYNAG